MKQELTEDGFTASEETSRRDMIPTYDEAFVFVSGGVYSVSPEKVSLRLVLIFSKGLSLLCPKECLDETFWFFHVKGEGRSKKCISFLITNK